MAVDDDAIKGKTMLGCVALNNSRLEEAELELHIKTFRKSIDVSRLNINQLEKNVYQVEKGPPWMKQKDQDILANLYETRHRS